jgi:uncharacterized phage protein (TIGR02218 family)
MKTISTGLKTAIDAGEICTLFSIVANDTTSRYFTDHDVQLVVGGHTFIPSAGVSRLKMKTTSNAEVSNQEVAATILDMPDDELKAGKWDTAQIEVAICSWRDVSQGKLIIFKGTIGVIQWTDEGFRADIQNYLRDLGRNIGSTVTANCRHQLFSTVGPGKIGACGIARSSYLSTGTVSYVLTQKLKIKISNTGRPAGWGTNGFIKFTSGNNSGLTYEVKIHEVAGGAIGESVELFLPCIGNIVIGDSFELTAGCDHTVSTCSAKFGNVVNFGGFPHLQVDVNANIKGG